MGKEKIIIMNTKVCTKCNVEKLTTDFHVASVAKNTFRTICKSCRKELSKQDYPRIKAKAIEFKYQHENNPIIIETKVCSKCKIQKQVSKFDKNITTKIGVTSTCKECRKQIRIDSNDKIKDINKKYYQNNTEKLKQKTYKHRLNNKDYYKQYNKEYKKNNKENINLTNNKRRNERMKSDPLFKLNAVTRTMIYRSIKTKGYSKFQKTEKILGCTIIQFKSHLESQFQEWMTWHNYGNPKDGIFELNKTWDIDHIIPVSSAKTEEELIKLNHYTNLQPLCSLTNRNIKKNKL